MARHLLERPAQALLPPPAELATDAFDGMHMPSTSDPSLLDELFPADEDAAYLDLGEGNRMRRRLPGLD